MEQVLNFAVDRLRSGQLNKEEQVKLAVILPILRALDWDDTNPSEFVPEFSVPGGSVDFALFDPDQRPVVFLEAKRLGNADEDGVDQVFNYANNRGVPFLILTDGNVWNFYMSMAAGTPPERRFCRIELQRDDDRTPDHARFFEKYLHKDRVGLSQTRIDAEDLRDGGIQREKARNTIPRVWRTLLTKRDEVLCSLIADAVEGECGTQPELDDVEAFLKGVLDGSLPPIQDLPPIYDPPPQSAPRKAPSQPNRWIYS